MIKVNVPVMIMSHCHGSKFSVLICKVPKLMKPEMICAMQDAVRRYPRTDVLYSTNLCHSLRLIGSDDINLHADLISNVDHLHQ